MWSTGNINQYRSTRAEYLKQVCKTQNLPLKIREVGFVSDERMKKQAMASLNIPQSKSWPISSPARILRSLEQGILPVMDRIFNDHPLEACALSFLDAARYGDRNAKQEWQQLIKSNVKKYNKLAERNTSEIISEIKLVLCDVEQHAVSFDYELAVALSRPVSVTQLRDIAKVQQYCDQTGIKFYG